MSSTPQPANTSEELHTMLIQMVAQAATNARDKTFKQADILGMAENMAHNYAPELERIISKKVQELYAALEAEIGEDDPVTDEQSLEQNYANDVGNGFKRKFRTALRKVFNMKEETDG